MILINKNLYENKQHDNSIYFVKTQTSKMKVKRLAWKKKSTLVISEPKTSLNIRTNYDNRKISPNNLPKVYTKILQRETIAFQETKNLANDSSKLPSKTIITEGTKIKKKPVRSLFSYEDDDEKLLNILNFADKIALEKEIIQKINKIEAKLNELTCPITLEIFSDPVKASDLKIYEREAIHKWLQSKTFSPITKVDIEWIQSDDTMKRRVSKYRGKIKKYKILLEKVESLLLGDKAKNYIKTANKTTKIQIVNYEDTIMIKYFGYYFGKYCSKIYFPVRAYI